MIYFIDEFLPPQIYDLSSQELTLDSFEKMTVGDKDFHVKFASKAFQKNVIARVEQREGRKIKNILSFFRVSTDEVDTDWRIHSDLNINGQRPDRAVVLFMSPLPEDSQKNFHLSGTALWKHKEHGYKLPQTTTDDKFDEVLLNDANDLTKWELNTVIGHRENRLISYPSEYFHSKFPDRSWPEGRMIYVMFYRHGE
tara:strand:+ start:578 stop:1168 length:591 start_codon:yes stop_codon:yes gene_type:complete